MSSSSSKNDSKTDPVNAKPGDVLAIDRGPYKHYGVKLTGDKMYHYTADSKGISGTTGIHKIDKVKDVAKDDPVTIDNQKQDKGVSGRNPKDIERMAKKLEGKKDQYDLFDNNCEHNANEIKYGDSKSEQVDNFRDVVSTATKIVTDPINTVKDAIQSVTK